MKSEECVFPHLKSILEYERIRIMSPIESILSTYCSFGADDEESASSLFMHANIMMIN